MPRTDTLLADPRLAEAERRLGRTLVKSVIADAQRRARAGEITPEQVADHAVAALPAGATSLRAVVNATGVVVHTNLGRAALSAAALDAMVTAAGATDVEFDLQTGRRARRGRVPSLHWPPRCRPRRAYTSSTTTPPRCCWPRWRWRLAGR